MALKKFNAVSGFSVGNDVIFDVIDDAANVSANNLTVTALSNLGDIGNVKISGGSSGQYLQTDGTGNLFWTSSSGGSGTGTPGGVNTEVQFNDSGSFGGAVGFTFDKSSSTLNVSGSITRGGKNVPTYAAALTPPSNPKMGDLWYDTNNDIIYQYIFDGTSSAWVDTTSGFISAAITASAGFLVQRDSRGNIYGNGLYGTSLHITGNSGLGNVATANYFSGNGSLLTIVTGANVSGNVAQSVHSYSSDVANSVSAGNIVGQVANALVSGTVYSNSQPNITSVGTLTSLNVTGDTTITGNLTVTGNYEYANVTSFKVKDPIIEQGGNPNGAALSSNDGFDRGQLLHYYSGSAVDAFMGWDNSNGEFAFGSNVSVSSEVVTFNSFGNVRANYFIGNGSQLTGLPESYTNSNVAAYLPTYTGNISANYFIGNGSTLTDLTGSSVVGNVSQAVHSYYSDVANSITAGNIVGQVSNALVAGTVYTNAQPNITSVGTLSSLAVTGNVAAGNLLTDHILYANGSPYAFSMGAVGNTTEIQFNNSGTFGAKSTLTFNSTTDTLSATNIAGSLTTASQPNITSVGTLTSLNVTGVTNLGSASNVKVTGGFAGYVLKTDGTGNLAWIDPASGAGAGFVSINRNNFVGDNTTKDFTLSSSPSSIQTLVVNINGLIQQISSYTLSGAVLSFATPPLSGEKIEVVVYGSVSLVGSDKQVQFNDGSSFGSTSAFTFDKTSNTLSVTGAVSTGNVNITGGISSNKANISVTTNTVIDQFPTTTYRSAKYHISAKGTNGYQSAEVLLVHDGANSFITIYGSICSNNVSDIVDFSSNVVSSKVVLYATTGSASTTVNLIPLYITD